MDAATLSGLFTSTTTTSSTTTTTSSSSSTTTDAADDDVTPRWNDGSVFKRVHAIQQCGANGGAAGVTTTPKTTSSWEIRFTIFYKCNKIQRRFRRGI